MNIIKGDLIKLAQQGQFDVIVHGCNCFNTMGSGIAAGIRTEFPGAWAVDQQTTRGDYNKLGNYSFYPDAVTVVNAYTQFDFNRPGERRDVFEYTAFSLILQKLLRHWPGDRRWGFPLIGCGLAGGDRQRILSMIDSFSQTVQAQGGTVTVVEYQAQGN